MKNSPFSIHNLNPGLVEEVEYAYAKNVEAGRVVDDTFAGDVAVDSLADILKHSVKNEAERSIIEGFDAIANPDTREAFGNTFNLEETLFERVGLTVPHAEVFTEAGVDFVELAAKYEKMLNDGLEPAVVIAPYHGSLDTWKNLYNALAKDSSSTITQRHSNNGIMVDGGVESQWTRLDSLPINAYPTAVTNGYSHDIPWTIRVIPCSEAPSKFNINYRADNALHPSIAEYLTLQATRAQSGKKLIDTRSYTWLKGIIPVAGANFALYGNSVESSGTINIGYIDEDEELDTVGSRHPQW